MQDSKFKYGEWRTNKPKEDGYSHELISTDSKFLINRGSNLDELCACPFEGVDTLYNAFQRNVKRIPNNDFLGTRVGDKYEWLSIRDTANIAEHFSYGIMALELAPSVEKESEPWRFIGIQSKNRKEWVLTSIAAQHQCITSVALYDTLGPDATKYILNQTELTTMAVSNDYIEKLSKLKMEDAKDASPKMFRLKNLISWEAITPEQK